MNAVQSASVAATRRQKGWRRQEHALVHQFISIVSVMLRVIREEAVFKMLFDKSRLPAVLGMHAGSVKFEVYRGIDKSMFARTTADSEEKGFLRQSVVT